MRHSVEWRLPGAGKQLLALAVGLALGPLLYGVPAKAADAPANKADDPVQSI